MAALRRQTRTQETTQLGGIAIRRVCWLLLLVSSFATCSSLTFVGAEYLENGRRYKLGCSGSCEIPQAKFKEAVASLKLLNCYSMFAFYRRCICYCFQHQLQNASEKNKLASNKVQRVFDQTEYTWNQLRVSCNSDKMMSFILLLIAIVHRLRVGDS